MTDSTALVAPLRLGHLLVEAREALGATLEELAERSGRFSRNQLDDAEHGRLALDDPTIEALIAAYGIEPGTLVPDRARLVIDLDEGRLAIEAGDASVDEIELDDAPSVDEVLSRYLGLVYAIRDLPIGSFIKLRDLDLQVLGAALQLQEAEVQRRLLSLIDNASPDVQRSESLFRRRLLVPVAGVLLGVTAVGSIVLVQGGDDPVPPATSAPVVEIGGAATVERPAANPPTVELVPATVVERDLADDAPNFGSSLSPGGYLVDTSEGPVELVDPQVVER